MKLKRPAHSIYNGCAPLALAAILGGTDAEYTKYGSTPPHKFDGMTDDEMLAALHTEGVEYLECRVKRYQAKRVTLADILPVEGTGFVTVSRNRRHHALAFNGKLVYDCGTDGRWQWVYDHYWSTATVRRIVFITPKEAA